MWQKFLHGWHGGFGLDQRSFRFWLINLVAFGLIGIFAYSRELELMTYAFAATLMVANSAILFLLLKQVPRIKLAMLTFLAVLNAVLFGYYYFSSISISELLSRHEVSTISILF